MIERFPDEREHLDNCHEKAMKQDNTPLETVIEAVGLINTLIVDYEFCMDHVDDDNYDDIKQSLDEWKTEALKLKPQLLRAQKVIDAAVAYAHVSIDSVDRIRSNLQLKKAVQDYLDGLKGDE